MSAALSSAGPQPVPVGGLLAWFQQHRRRLPWRSRRTAYRVWVSELMLQQTRVDQVVPYYRRFMKQFPDLATLAKASQQEVLKAWEGLGYYSRARRLHATARYLAGECGGKFPRTMEGLLALPGIGPYTAAAIGSLAFHLDEPVLDGNVMRVLARLDAVSAPVDKPATRRAMLERARALLPAGKGAAFNEAMMELGATVCLPRKPRCTVCPVRSGCRARQTGGPEQYPVKTRRAPVPHRHVGAAVIIRGRDGILLAQRKEDSMLGGMWEFPGGGVEPGETVEACIARELMEEMGIRVAVGPHLMTVRHAFSHFTMDLHVHWVRIRGGKPRPIQCGAVQWIRRGELSRFPLPKADFQVAAKLLSGVAFPEF